MQTDEVAKVFSKWYTEMFENKDLFSFFSDYFCCHSTYRFAPQPPLCKSRLNTIGSMCKTLIDFVDFRKQTHRNQKQNENRKKENRKKLV